MKERLNKPVIRTIVLFFGLFAIGLFTRIPALHLTQFYALHGVLAAPFFSALALIHFQRKGGVWDLFVAVIALAVLLGAMSPVMGLSFLMLDIVLVIADFTSRRLGESESDLIKAVIFGFASYPCTFASGTILGTYIFSSIVVPTALALLVLSTALAILGAVAVSCTHNHKGSASK